MGMAYAVGIPLALWSASEKEGGFVLSRGLLGGMGVGWVGGEREKGGGERRVEEKGERRGGKRRGRREEGRERDEREGKKEGRVDGLL